MTQQQGPHGQPRPPERGRNSPWAILIAIGASAGVLALVVHRQSEIDHNRQVERNVDQFVEEACEADPTLC